MTMKYTTASMVEVAMQGKTAPNCDQTLQLKPVYAKDGTARSIWNVDDHFTNAFGVAMGGYVSAAADSTIAYAVASMLSPEKTFLTIDMNTTFHKGVKEGVVDVEAKVERMGNKLAYITAQLFQNGERVASVTSSAFIR